MSNIPSRQPSNVDIFSAWTRPNPISDEYPLVREYQTWLDQTTDYADKMTLANDQVADLDARCTHIDKDIVIFGTAYKINVTKQIDDNEFIKIEPEDIEVQTQNLHGVVARSLGYYAIGNLEQNGAGDPTLYHIAMTHPEPVLMINSIYSIYKATQIYIPVDGRAHSETLEEPQDAHMPLLEYYAGDLIDSIDQAVLNADNPTQLVRRLSKIDLSSVNGFTDDTVTKEVVRYINNISSLSTNIPHTIKGHKKAIIELQKDTYVAFGIPPGTAMTGTVNQITLTNEHELALDMHIVYKDSVSRRTAIPLSSRMFVSEIDTVNIIQPLT